MIEIRATPLALPQPDSVTQNLPKTPSGPRFTEVLAGVGGELDRGQMLMERAASGVGSQDAAQLISLQAGIYRYSETVELVSKVVEQTQSALRTTLSER